VIISRLLQESPFFAPPDQFLLEMREQRSARDKAVRMASQMPIGPNPDTVALLTAVRDLVGLSTIRTAWVGREPSAIAAGLVDVLVGSLHLDFAFVRLCDPKGGAAVEATRGDAWKSFPEWLRRYLAVSRLLYRDIIPDIGARGQPCRGVVIPIGVGAEDGLVAAASGRTNFPDEIDQLLLSVAANHGAAAYQNGSLLHERRRAEEELRQARNELEMRVAERTAELYRTTAEAVAAQQRFRDMVNTLDGIVWEADAETFAFSFVSDQAERILGYPVERWSEPTFWRDHLHPEDRDRAVAFRAKATSENRNHDFEYRMNAADGRTVWLRDIVVVVAAGDRATRLRGVMVDITNWKLGEEALRQARTDLAHLSRMTTLGQLTASLVHEIRQPLAAASTNAQACLRWLARDPPDLKEAREAASRLVKDTTLASDIIDRVRPLFKKGAPQREMVDVNEVIREMSVVLQHEATLYSISIRAELALGLPRVLVDRVQLQQVLMNLMLNGIEAMKDTNPAGELTIRSQQDEHHMLISVSDTGVGLAPEQADQIFKAFFTTKPQGTGMGLSISQSIIESHGGRLWSAANAGRGATFHLTLPIEVEMKQSPYQSSVTATCATDRCDAITLRPAGGGMGASP
jgi:PAS domain S-box-containing protein